MQNFLRLAEGIAVMPLLLAIRRRPDLWDQNTLRTTHPGTPHTRVSDIWLRFNDLEKFRASGEATDLIDEHESVNYPAYKTLVEARPIVQNLMAFTAGERLGRVLITKLRPGDRIDPHEDGGSHADYYSRFHVVLESHPGVDFRCGDEHVYMAPGEVWWFNNKLEHEVRNNSAGDRIHMIVDIRTSR
jgi:hypothetical protein